MLFRTVDHYFNEDDAILLNEKEKEKSTECFICYEDLNDIEPIIKLNNNSFYLKSCNCDGFIHKKCLDMWFNSKTKCPICRFTMSKNTAYNYINKKMYFNVCVASFYNNINAIKKPLFTFFIILITFDFVCNNSAFFFDKRLR